jgi:hypothetical protein
VFFGVESVLSLGSRTGDKGYVRAVRGGL